MDRQSEEVGFIPSRKPWVLGKAHPWTDLVWLRKGNLAGLQASG